MTPTYVLDTGALVAAERNKPRATRFFQLKQAGAAQLVVPYPVLAEWWRGRTDLRDDMLAATIVVASTPAAKAAGIALSRIGKIDAQLTVDAVVIATAALLDGIVVTGNRDDFEKLAKYFPGVTVLSV